MLLGIRPGGRALRIHRLRLADGEPMSIDTSHLPARRFPGLRKQLERHRSLYETLALRVRRPAGRGRGDDRDRAGRPARRRPARPSTSACRCCCCPGTRSTSTGEPVEWAQSWYRGDRYKFVTRLRRYTRLGPAIIVSGTDTGVGKTVTTAAIAALARSRGERVAVVKPAQTGEPPGTPGDLGDRGRPWRV